MSNELIAEPAEQATGRLLGEIACPNCWFRFAPERILFVARHEALIGDDVVGDHAYRRFLPTRFNVAGDAIDARGMACQELACPRCHLTITRPLVEMQPFFCSIAGAPASGKSYFLATMTWELRSRASRFGLVFSESDPTANYELQRYEETLFLSPDPDQPIEIRKTETQGTQLYQTVFLEGQPQTFPRPFQFTVSPAITNRKSAGEVADDGYRSVVLYDNAGEHFLPGQDSTNLPVTLHLAEAGAIFFIFDPTQDPRFRQRCTSDDPQLKFGNRADSKVFLMRQEAILTELASRVRRYKGLSHTSKHRKPLIVILAKADIWANMVGVDMNQEPVVPGSPDRLDLKAVEAASKACGQLMRELCPEIAAAAENFATTVKYIPVSSLGTSPEMVEQGEKKFYGVRPSKIHPRWVTVPLLWALASGVPGLVPTT